VVPTHTNYGIHTAQYGAINFFQLLLLLETGDQDCDIIITRPPATRFETHWTPPHGRNALWVGEASSFLHKVFTRTDWQQSECRPYGLINFTTGCMYGLYRVSIK